MQTKHGKREWRRRGRREAGDKDDLGLDWTPVIASRLSIYTRSLEGKSEGHREQGANARKKGEQRAEEKRSRR